MKLWSYLPPPLLPFRYQYKHHQLVILFRHPHHTKRHNFQLPYQVHKYKQVTKWLEKPACIHVQWNKTILHTLMCTITIGFTAHLSISTPFQIKLVSFEAVVWASHAKTILERKRCMTSPNNGCEGDYCQICMPSIEMTAPFQ